MGKNRHGAAGEDLIIKVPVGTIIKDAETGEELADLAQDGQRIVLLKGDGAARGMPALPPPPTRPPSSPSQAKRGKNGPCAWN